MVEVEETEARHIAKVLRHRSGDIIHLTDGRGNLYRAELNIVKNSVQLLVQEKIRSGADSHLLEIAVAPTKNNERLEWFVEKAVEIGVGKISLIHCEHSERSRAKVERLEKLAISAMKQSLKLHLPAIGELVDFEKWLESASAEIKCIAHCYEGEKRFLKNVLKPGKTACIAIGPEGDFSKEEIKLALTHGFVPVSLGNSRLRTETAALAAVHTFEIINQIMSAQSDMK